MDLGSWDSEFLGANKAFSVLGNKWTLLHPPWKE